MSDESEALSYRLTFKPLQLGLMFIPKKVAGSFPRGTEPTKIIAVFDDSDKEVELTYNSKRRRLYGLTGWYRSHNAKIGDIVTIEPLEPFKKYRFRLERKKEDVKTLVAHRLPKRKERREKSIVGQVINFRGLVYAPVNEQGVVFLFGKIIEDLNMYLEEIRTAFPDAIGRRFDGRGWVRETIEFEYRSSDYRLHKHPVEGCDIIVCWEHDWTDCPIEVIELKGLVKELSKE